MVNQSIKKLAPFVVIDNKIIKSKYTLTLNEQRIILLALTQIQPYQDIKDGEVFYITTNDFSNKLGVSIKNASSYIFMGVEKLKNREISIPTNYGFLTSNWVDSVIFYDKNIKETIKESFSSQEEYERYIKDIGSPKIANEPPPEQYKDAVVGITFHRNIIPFLSNLRKNFTKFYLEEVSDFKASYSFRIYMLLIQDRKKGELRISIEELRDFLELNNMYSNVQDFKRSVVDKAVKELNEKSMYFVQYEFYKDKENGFKRISHVYFSWQAKDESQEEKMAIVEMDEFTRAELQKYLESHNITDEDYINNLAKKAAREDWGKTKREEHELELAKQKELQEKEKLKKEAERQEQQERDEQAKLVEQAILFYESLPTELQEKVRKHAKSLVPEGALRLLKWNDELAHKQIYFQAYFVQALAALEE